MKDKISRKWKIGILILFFIIVTVETIILGQVETKQFSAYATCRDLAIATRGYAIWKHISTKQTIPTTRVTFSDRTNDLVCDAIGIGPFWIIVNNWHTLVGCVESFEPKPKTCPEDYYGVSP
jgi:hypothetical protein